MIIRKAKFEDVPFCLEVQASQEDSTFLEHDFRNSIVDSHAIFLVAEQNQQVIGFILGFIVPTRMREATIHSTMVDKRHTRKGVGSLLVQNFAKDAFEQGAELIEAEVEEGPDKFYEKCGFKKVMVWHSMVLKKSV
jgi:N-acetylglutamate synthase-like GNAT family acetyltransferase